MQNNQNLTNIIELQTLNPISNFENYSIFNKTCNQMTNKLIGDTNLLLNDDKLLTNLNDLFQTGSANNIIETNTLLKVQDNQYYSILGYNLSFWTLILMIIILSAIIYFIYRWFFNSSNNNIVSIKKPKNIIELTTSTPNKLNNEINDTDNSSDSTSSNSSNDTSTLSKKEEKV